MSFRISSVNICTGWRKVIAMADKGPFGIYTVPTPSKPSGRPPWRYYLLDYIVPGLVVLGALRLLAWILAWWA
jgi:hypothetical protein